MFGMGTGGSLRLLSPETKRSLDSFAAALFLPSGRPRTASRLSLLRFALFASLFAAQQPCFPHPQNRTGSSSVHRLTKASHVALLETFPLLRFRVFHKPLAPGFIGLRFHWISFPCDLSHALLIPNPYSLIPSLKIKPSTD